MSVARYQRSRYSPAYVLPTKVPLDKRQVIYEKTLLAITFDVCRGLLPIGATTSVAWSGELRTFSHHLKSLMASPLPEVSRIATDLYSSLLVKYPNSFAAFTPSEDLLELQWYEAYYVQFGKQSRMDVVWTPNGHSLLAKAPQEEFRKELLPFMNKELRYACQFTMQDKLDFASYRDIQRHRHGYMSLSIPNRDVGLNAQGWYGSQIKEADPELWIRVETHFEKTLRLIGRTHGPAYQYFLPMMVNVPIKAVWNLHQMIYVCNLRSGVTVHPTLRNLVARWAKQVTPMLGREVFTIDTRGEYEASYRGDQDISVKTNSKV